MDTDFEAGPSRPRRSTPPIQSSDMDTDTDGGDAQSTSHRTSSRPASPETAFASRLHDSETEPPHSPPHPPMPHLDLAAYPTATLLRLIANLLQQIASANDQIRPELEEADGEMGDQSQSSRSGSRASSVAPGAPAPSPTAALFSERDTFPSTSRQSPGGIDPSSPLPLFTASRTSLVHPSSLLSFHARHVPSISIEAYLLRILKYCPTTNEVFLSLLVYFDRMSRLGTASGVGAGLVGKNGKGFAIDSFNVHRLVIAGVTVASKFFSDVFYTNSRYAKVGGLPPHELNQLELQFLLLNDFRLAIPTDEMQRYGDRLLSYWDGREEETGVDVATGRELSENGRRRAREKRDKEREAREAEGREKAAKAGIEVEADGEWPKGDEIPSKEEGMEVDGSGAEKAEAASSDPALPPPEPMETASAPSGVGGATEGDGREDNDAAGPPQLQHSTTNPLPASSTAETLSAQSSAVPSPSPSPAPPPPANGARQKERSSSAVVPSPINGTRTLSFSRGDVGGMGMGWGKGDQGVVAVSGTG